ncbi:putative PEP-binding protein [Photobacterium aquae]|uniref:putative PEP-binding protein n=1 Tax=Photobacterium aquae TaxID=1195763 RepID=UPI001F0B548E|nr:putative PEP-binding protein [Photobacterium aquae]
MQLGKENYPVGMLSLDGLVQEVGMHPYAIAYPEQLPGSTQQQLLAQTENSPAEFWVEAIAQKIIRTAEQYGEEPLLVCLSGADSHQRKGLLGAEMEELEINPLIGLRGVSRFAEQSRRKAFELECEAVKRAQSKLGSTGIELVLPFVRTFSEAATVCDLLAEQGLARGVGGLKIHLCAQLPANALLAETFLQYFDGVVVDIDQLAQFALGLDESHPKLDYLYDDRNEAILLLVRQLLLATHAVNKPCSIVSRHITTSAHLQSWLKDHGVSSVMTP